MTFPEQQGTVRWGAVLGSSGVRLSIPTQHIWKHCFLWYSRLLSLVHHARFACHCYWFSFGASFCKLASNTWTCRLSDPLLISDHWVVARMQILFFWPNQIASVHLNKLSKTTKEACCLKKQVGSQSLWFPKCVLRFPRVPQWTHRTAKHFKFLRGTQQYTTFVGTAQRTRR